jgi:predicted Zn-ribbon and HTH transcriptional regulator
MKLLEKIRGFLRPEDEPEAPPPAPMPVKLKKTCKNCGKTFTVDPAWGFVPTFCKDCKQQMAKEKETRQRAGALREIKRKCKDCGKFFTFPSDTARYPVYCPDCRKRNQAAKKEKYSRKKA